MDFGQAQLEQLEVEAGAVWRILRSDPQAAICWRPFTARSAFQTPRRSSFLCHCRLLAFTHPETDPRGSPNDVSAEAVSGRSVA